MRRTGFLLIGLLWIVGCARVGLNVETVIHEDGSFHPADTSRRLSSARKILRWLKRSNIM